MKASTNTAVADVDAVTPATLASYDVVLLAKTPLTAAQVSMFSTWVNGGGNLIAMAPDAQLAPLLGLTPLGTTLSNAYLAINTGSAPGAGLVSQTIQFHGSADRYTLNGATSVATLYSNATTATANPAVSLRTAGSGNAAAFTYDLASSVVYTRQGNPAWATQERDGFAPDTRQRQVLRQCQRRSADRLDRCLQDRDSAGRRTTAPAGQPDPARQQGQEAAAALLVLPARQEGRGHHDRR